jgi:predicted metal-dependent hydrolase
MSSTRASEALFRHEDLPLPIEIRGIRSARRLRLRLDENRGLLKLTGPLRMNRKAALDWAAQQREWVEAQIDAMLPNEPFAPGCCIPIDGQEVELIRSDSGRRSAHLEGGRLTCGGTHTGFARRIELFLRRRALEVLSRETAEIAGKAGVTVRSVALGDADTRWGSCTSTGQIRYSWRLILAPPAARRYVVAHEVAHMRHMNHGPEFRALEAELFDGDCDAARLLLRRVGSRLKRIGRGR